MNAKKFSDAMSEIDGKYIEEALSYNVKTGQPRGSRRVSVALVAAILILLLAGCTAVAYGVFGTRLIELFTSSTEPGTEYAGFDLGVAIERIPINDLTGEVREAGDVIKRQFETYQAYDSWYPGQWQTDFSTRDKACEYIGFDKLKRLDWDFEEQMTTLSVFGNEQGQILSVNLETYYVVEDMNVQFVSQIYTEHYDEEFILSTRTTEGIEFKESFYTTANNRQCHIISSSTMESGYMCLDGYIVEEGVLYHLHLAYREENSTRAMELMHQWADLF